MKKITLFNLLICISVFNLKAQQSVNQELIQLVNKSFSYNPRVNELQQSVMIQEQRVDIAKTYLFPTISATGSYNYITPVGLATFPTGPNTSEVIQFQPNNNVSFGLGFNYQALDFGRSKAAIEKSKNELLQSKDNVEFNKAQLANQIAALYYGINYLRKAISVQDSVLASLQQNLLIAQSKFKNGDALELDILIISANIDAEKNRKIELETALQKQKTLLFYTSGVNSFNNNDSFSFNEINLLDKPENFLVQAEQTNVDFKLIKYKTLLTQNDWNIAKRAFYPSLNIIGNAGIRNGFQPNIDKVRFNYLVGLSLNAPLFQGGRFKQQKQLFDATTKLNDFNISTLKNNYERDITQAITDINSYNERIENIKGQIFQAQRALELSQSRYKNGTAIQIEFINALNTLQKIKLSALNYEYQKCLSQIELTRLLGTKWW